MATVIYRCCEIQRNWKTTSGPRQPDEWTWAHMEYDGPEDGRCGFETTLEACIDAIDEMHEGAAREVERLRERVTSNSNEAFDYAEQVERLRIGIARARAWISNTCPDGDHPVEPEHEDEIRATWKLWDLLGCDLAATGGLHVEGWADLYKRELAARQGEERGE